MLHVACSADERFAPDLAVMLASLTAAHRPEALHVHLLHDDGLSAGSAAALRELVSGPGGRCDLHPVPAVGAGAASARFPATAWYRIDLPELLPGLDRVLYLDADTLVLGSLEELFATDLGGLPLGAVSTYLYPSMVSRIVAELGIADVRTYFNSGVLLLDLAVWRAQGTSAAVAAFARDHPLVWPDQDALNGVLHGHHARLHPRWNAMPGLWELPASWMPYDAVEAEQARRDPAVVHFVGPYKPYHFRSRSPYRGCWHAQLAQTPWRERPLQGRTLRHRLLRRLPPARATELEIAVMRHRASLHAAVVRRFPALARR